MKDDQTRPEVRSLGRRDLVKMGLGAGAVASQFLKPQSASAQEGAPKSAERASARPVGVSTQTEVGWKNDSGRASGNGPMDEISKQLVEYTKSFSESNLTDSVTAALGRTMLDVVSCVMAGFESEPARICARLARTTRSDLKSTVMGYGVTTTPELAAFANASMLRHCDLNDDAPGGHVSDIIPGILAMGEALHSTGSQVLAAITLGYELVGGLAYGYEGEGGLTGSGSAAAANENNNWDSWAQQPATALAVGKLLGLNEDQLANALSLALVPHMPMKVSHTGALSMWKGCHDPDAIRCSVFAALMAREGMTGPCQPFAARWGLQDHLGPFKDELQLPARPTMSPGTSQKPDARMCVERARFKRWPSDGHTQAVQEVLPAVREWTKVDDIASIHLEINFSGWMECGDPPKWDPRNSETADHSLPYVIARSLLDGEIYIDSFTPEKYMDPIARRLMEKITISPNPDFTYQGRTRLTVRNKSGGEMVKETAVRQGTQLTPEQIVEKYNRVCAFRSVTNEQRDRVRAVWTNLRAVKDFAEPMRMLAHFGRPQPL